MLAPGVVVEVVEGDLVQVHLPGRSAIVNPANTLGFMGGGVAGAIKRAGGEAIEAEARKRSPIPLGGAQLTTAGQLPFTGIIHAPTMTRPAEAADADVVRLACHAAVKLAHGERLDSIAFPGMGTGIGGLAYEEAAEAMVQGLVEGLRECKAPPPSKLVLVAFGPELRKAFEVALRVASSP